MPSPHPDTATVTSLVEDAITAPSMHNAQPWKFHHRSGTRTIELHGDRDRTMPAPIPRPRPAPGLRGRPLQSAGRCREGRIRAGDTAAPLPRRPLAPGRRGTPRSLTAGRRDAKYVSRTATPSHEPFPVHRRGGAGRDPRRTSGSRSPGRRQAAGADAWHVDVLLGLVQDAEIYEADDPAAREETERWTASRTRDHAPMEFRRPPRASSVGCERSGTGLRRPAPRPDRVTARFEAAPRSRSSVRSWTRPGLAAPGQALQRVLLRATLDGVVTSMTSQPLEWPELRWTARDPVSAMGHVHMIMRLGYGPEGPATPRRPAREVLTIA